MGYDAEKDKKLWEKEAVVSAKSNIVVGIYQYGSGKPKVGIVRKNFTEKGDQWGKLGRLYDSEVNILIELLNEAAKKLLTMNTSSEKDDDPTNTSES